MKEPFALLYGEPVNFSNLPLWAVQKIAAGQVPTSETYPASSEGVSRGFAAQYAQILLRERGL